jgi:hypothetical protein
MQPTTLHTLDGHGFTSGYQSVKRFVRKLLRFLHSKLQY